MNSEHIGAEAGSSLDLTADAPHGWQPLETAPLTGVPVWVADANSMCVAYFSGKEHRCWRNWFKGPRYENAKLGTDAFLPEPVWFTPTHWQPLPKPCRS